MDIAQLFDALGYEDFSRFVAERREENLYLDFKSVTRADLSSADDRRNFAKALSGFANSSGGLVVWGIVAKRASPQGPDCAVSLHPIENAQLFVTRLNEFTGMFVRPIVDGVRHRFVADERGAGFAVSLIPESDAGPHMALGGEGRYFKRSGDSFYPLEHFDLEDMFGRRRRPRIEIALSLRPGGYMSGGGRTTHKGKIILTARNTGRGSAKALYLELRVTPPYELAKHGIDGNGNEALVLLPGGSAQAAKFVAPAHLVIHPGTEHPIAAIDVSGEIGAAPADVQLAFGYAAEDVPMQQQTVRFPGNALLEGLLSQESRPVV